MNRKIAFLFGILIFIVLFLFIFYASAAQINSTNYGIDTLTVSSGGQLTNSSNYKTDFLVSTVAGKSASSSYQTQLGFFYGTQGDIYGPVITIISPGSNQVYNITSISFNVTLSEVSSWCGYSLDEGGNVTMTKNTDTNFEMTSIVSEGNHNVTFYCNDTQSNMGSSSIRYFSVDLTNPTVTITFPTATNYDYIIANMTYTATDPHLNSCWYSTNSGAIQNNTIKTIGNYGYGIYLYQNSTLNTITNNAIITSGASYGRGIYLYTDSNNNSIINNIINTSGTNYGMGIDLETRSNSNLLLNNTIKTIQQNGWGIHLITNSNLNILANNIIITSGTGGQGIYLRATSNLNVIANNTVTTASGSGIYLYDLNSNIFLNNLITTTGASARGIEFASTSSNSNILANNTIITSGSNGHGIFLGSGLNNNTFSGMRVITNGTAAYGLYLYFSTINLTIIDSIINASNVGVPDLYLEGSTLNGIWNFTNVTRANGIPITIKWLAGAKGKLNMNWYLQVNVTRANTNALVSDANVTAYNSSGNAMFSTLTGADGLTLNYPLWYFTMTNSSAGTNTTIYSELYTINVTKAEFTNFTNSTINMTSNLLFNARLLGGPSTCTCTGSGNNWEISMADNCLINDNCDLNLGNITFTGTGAVTLNSTIHCKNLGSPAAGQTLTIGSNALIMVG